MRFYYANMNIHTHTHVMRVNSLSLFFAFFFNLHKFSLLIKSWRRMLVNKFSRRLKNRTETKASHSTWHYVMYTIETCVCACILNKWCNKNPIIKWHRREVKEISMYMCFLEIPECDHISRIQKNTEEYL